MALFNAANGIHYAWWNHTISELGFPAASSATWVFNSTLVVVGIAVLPIHNALRLELGPRLGKIAAGFGFVTCASISAIGAQGLQHDIVRSPYRFLPYLNVHNWISGVFFIGWVVTVSLFTVIFIRRWRDPFCRMATTIGIGSLLLIPAFLWTALFANPTQAGLMRDLKGAATRSWLTSPTTAAVLSPWFDLHRPHVWWPAILEWSLAGSFIVWHATALLVLWTPGTRAGEP